MICHECGKKYTDNKLDFCPSCGSPVNRDLENLLICPECMSAVKTEDSYCAECGCPIEYILKNQIKKALFSATTDSEILIEASEEGNAEAMYWVAYCYYYGENDFDEDEERAKHWLKKSIELGYKEGKSDYENWFNDSVDEVYESDDYNGQLKKLFNIYDSIVVVDIETSGLDFVNSNIIELASVKLKYKDSHVIISEKMDEFIQLPYGERLESKIVDLTGITDSKLDADGISADVALSRFVEVFLNQKTLVIAYNAQFDMNFLINTLKKNNLDVSWKNVDIIDALTVFKDRRQYPHKLINAIEAYNISDEVANTHRAIDDVLALVEVLKAMDDECDDLDNYINLFGYNPKYGVQGEKINFITYLPQPYNGNRKLYQY